MRGLGTTIHQSGVSVNANDFAGYVNSRTIRHIPDSSGLQGYLQERGLDVV